MNEKTTEDLEFFRDKIDKVDQQLLALIRQRLDLVAKVGQVKHSAGLPIYAPEREASMLAKRRNEAEQKGVPPQLIEDILHRLMRESYLNEKQMGFKQIKADLGTVVIIGGAGAMGQLFAQMFELSGYQVVILDKEHWEHADIQLSNAGLVLVTVPINATCKLIREKLSKLPADCILADLTSVKDEPLAAMLETHTGPVVGLHPMFGADVGSFAKQLLLVCHGRRSHDYQWFLQQMGLWGAEIIELQAKEHDQMMQWVQAMRYFPTFVYGLNLYRHQIDIHALLQFSSPVYRLDLAMVARLFAQSPQLYADIIFSQLGNKQLIGGYLEQYKQAFELLEAGDKDTFIQWFKDVSHWFAETEIYPDRFLS